MRRGKPQELRVGPEMDQETACGAAQLSARVRWTPQEGLPSLRGAGEGARQRWAPGRREAHAGTGRHECTRLEMGAESHSVWLFMEYEVLVSGVEVREVGGGGRGQER